MDAMYSDNMVSDYSTIQSWFPWKRGVSHPVTHLSSGAQISRVQTKFVFCYSVTNARVFWYRLLIAVCQPNRTLRSETCKQFTNPNLSTSRYPPFQRRSNFSRPNKVCILLHCNKCQGLLIPFAHSDLPTKQHIKARPASNSQIQTCPG